MHFSFADYLARTDGLAKLDRNARYGLDLVLPEWLLYNRVVRPLWGRFYRDRLRDHRDNDNPLFMVAPALGPEHVAGCVVYASREALVAAHGRNGVWCEIGTFEGRFARHILDACAPAELHLVDIDFAPLKAAGVIDEGGPVRLHEGCSHKTLEGFPDGYFDCIYLDAGGDLESMTRDALAAEPKLRPGGVLFFVGYMAFSHVDIIPMGSLPVANALCVERGWTLVGLSLHNKMYCNVALRRPGA